MEIKPLNDSTTIKFSIAETSVKSLQAPAKEKTDKEGIIPNSIYKVIRWEVFRQRFTMIFSSIILIVMIIMVSLYASDAIHVGWASYIIPITVSTFSLLKFLKTLQEFTWLRKAVRLYKEGLRVNLGTSSTPPFISRIYVELHRKQIAHNWLTFTLLFYGGILTVLLWLLKDVSWWIFEFKKWIHSLFSNPDLMSWLFTAALIIIVVAHIVFMIQRRARILDINAYYGQSITPESEISVIKQERNKFYRRLFIVSVIVILIIPLVIKLILRIIRLKK